MVELFYFKATLVCLKLRVLFLSYEATAGDQTILQIKLFSTVLQLEKIEQLIK